MLWHFNKHQTWPFLFSFPEKRKKKNNKNWSQGARFSIIQISSSCERKANTKCSPKKLFSLSWHQIRQVLFISVQFIKRRKKNTTTTTKYNTKPKSDLRSIQCLTVPFFLWWNEMKKKKISLCSSFLFKTNNHFCNCVCVDGKTRAATLADVRWRNANAAIIPHQEAREMTENKSTAHAAEKRIYMYVRMLLFIHFNELR